MKRIPLHQLVRKQFPELTGDDILVKILSGQTFVNGEKIRDKSVMVPSSGVVEFKNQRPFVSRGGDKLNYILDLWNYSVKGRIFLDGGCSTGGFTHCLLTKGAARVYSVDVGFNQFDYNLKQDPRIVLMEETNVKSLTRSMFSPPPEVGVCDLSFRSIKGIGPLFFSIITGDEFIALIKPQFEYLNPPEDFSGVIKDKKLLYSILSFLISEFYKEGLGIRRIGLSPVKGRKGNREFFFLITKTATSSLNDNILELDNLFDSLML